MKKKVMSVVIALCLVLGSAAALPQNAFVDSTSISVSAEVSGDWEYEALEDGTVAIKNYNGKETSVTIPATLGGKKVSTVYRAFWNDPELRTVTVSNGITKLLNTFSGCSKLQKVILPNSLKTIGFISFEGCANLKSLVIPDSVTAIEGKAFRAAGLESITIPKSVTIIDENAFAACVNLKKVTIPGNVKKIGGMAFSSCQNLTDVTIENGVEEIGGDAFECCEKLKTVSIPNSVSVLGAGAFEMCTALTSCIIPSGIQNIYSGTFAGCANLESVIIPSSVTSIHEDAFSDCKKLTIKSTDNSTAKEFAKKNNIPFAIVAIPTRLAGASRFDTAVEISKACFETADTVVLAYGMNYADALAGVSLAKAMNAPILLTNLKELPAETLAEIKRLKATNVVILGGPGAVGTEVEKALTDNKLNVERIAGASRFETATKIAEKMQKLNGDKAPEDVFFVYYNGFADALSVSTVAAAKGAPVIYLQTNGDLDDATAAYLKSVKGKVKNAYVIGGTGVITDEMMKKAGDALGVKATRVFGKDRFETCVAVNEKFADVLNGDSICVATGMDFPDALAGGVFAALNKAPLFLVNGKENPLKLSDLQKSYLGTKAPQKLYVFGGAGVVSDSHVQTVADACGVYSPELLDTDKDGLLDNYEEMLGTDKTVSDTDKDGLTDYEEIYITNTDPTKYDYVTDGVSDADADNDKDGLTNKREIDLKTNPNNADTDGDTLKDNDEISKYKTDPLTKDTDEDGLEDDDEIKFNCDPNKKDTDNNGIIDGKEKHQQTLDVVPDNEEQAVTKVSVSMNAANNIEKTTIVESIMNKDALCSSVVGLVGEPFSIESESSFDKATITFTVDKTKLGETKFDDLMFLWYDKENDNFVELETSHDAANSTVSIETTHFSDYMIADSKQWFENWRQIEADWKKHSTSGSNVLHKINPLATILYIKCYPSSDPDFYNPDPNSVTLNTKTNYRTLISESLINSMWDTDIMKMATTDQNWYFAPLGRDEPGWEDSFAAGDYCSDKTILRKRLDLVINKASKTSILQDLVWASVELSRINDVDRRIVYITDHDGPLDYSVFENRTPEVNEMKKSAYYSVPVYFVCIGDFEKPNLEKVAAETGGKVFTVTTTSDVREFYNSTDRLLSDMYPKDSDGDGLTDFEEMCGVYNSAGVRIITDALDEDTDDDGLKDGDEITERLANTSGKGGDKDIVKYYYYVKSYPTKADSDGDGYNDKEDREPMIWNSNFGSLHYKGEWYDIEVPGFVDPDSKNNNISIPNIRPDFSDLNSYKPYLVDNRPNNTFIVSQEKWEPVDEGVSKHVSKTDMEKLLSNLCFDRVEDKPGSYNKPDEYDKIPHPSLTIIGMVTGFLTALNNSIDSYDIFFSYEKRVNKRRVIIYVTNSSIRDIYNQYANDITYSALSRVRFYNRSDKSKEIKENYEKLTGKQLDNDGTYDLQISVDSRHKQGKYSSYLWIGKDGQIMEKPIIFPNDRVKYVETNNDELLLNVDLESGYFETSDMNSALFLEGEYDQKSKGIY